MNSKYHLLIFQLEAYRLARFLNWLVTHRFEKPKEKKEPVWTNKAKAIYSISIILFILTITILFATQSTPFALALCFVLWFNYYLFLMLALIVMQPYEITNRLRVKHSIYSKIKSLKQLIVVGITGSFGKTSTKLILHQLLPDALITPKSYNTMFGIYKVVDYELNKRYKVFICEMGAYKRGDIKEFCEITRPKVAVLTGINEQHLERFGSIENTIKAKFEILAKWSQNGIGIANLDNKLIRENLSIAKVDLIGYTTDGHTNKQCQQILSVKNWQIKDGKTIFELDWMGSTYSGTTPLLGRGHLSNILAATCVCLNLGENIKDVLERVQYLEQIPHRLELRANPGLTILDDTYSSNPSGFREALDLLNRFEGKKVLITPGIVELGKDSESIHLELGKLAARICDEIVLVGNSTQTKALQQGMTEAGFATNKVFNLKSRSAVPELLSKKVGGNEIILMENDLPDQYL